MAKDVDLSSKEWREIIFDGKNKEFGAYELRQKSDGRHNWSMLAVVVVIIVAFLLSALINTVFQKSEEELLAETEQVLVDISTQTEEPEEEPEEELERYEEEKPEVLPEEVLNTVKVTELAIVDDDQVTKEDEIKTTEELQQVTTAFGQTDFDKGTDDRNVVREHKDEIVVEEKKEEVVFKAVEQMPQFPGGDAELMKYISKNIKYPTMAMENNIQGRVVVQFVVTKTGAIGEVKVIRSKDPDLDKEAVR
ncbi:MAG: TonB family protein, partial [Muribaculaceae bacterium]|nr:TonB family protein [Muribaculaceae bacterium]